MSDAIRRGGPQPAPPGVTADDVVPLPLENTNRIILMALIMVATAMQVLDATIANVALPHMQAALGATPDTITWVLTSYIVAAAIAMPVTGWLADRFGRRALMLTAVGGFTLASMLCGLATSLPMMIGARLLQGIFGAFISPLGQSIILDTNPRSKHPQVMTVWGIATLIAPVLGPVLGGWLTDSFDWRWVFFVNAPFGIVTLVGLLAFMPHVPTGGSRFDGFGFLLLFLAIGCFQLMIDRGERADWFDSTEIWVEAAIALGAAWMFIVHTNTTRQPILAGALFRDRNLMLASIFVLVVMGILLAASSLLPPFLQRLLGYDAYTAGLLTAPRGVGMLASMVVVARLTNVFKASTVVTAGVATTAASLYMMTGFTLDMGMRPVIVSGIVQGVGLGLILLPLNLMAFGTLDPRYRTQAAGFYNLARNLGGSIAISVMTTLLARQQQIAHSDIGSHVTEQGVPLYALSQLGRLGYGYNGVVAAIDGEVNRQAAMISYIDAFYLMFWLVVAMAPLVLFLRPPRSGPPVHVSVE